MLEGLGWWAGGWEGALVVEAEAGGLAEAEEAEDEAWEAALVDGEAEAEVGEVGIVARGRAEAGPWPRAGAAVAEARLGTSDAIRIESPGKGEQLT